MNIENNKELEEVEMPEGLIGNVAEEEVQRELKGMKDEKVFGVTNDIFKQTGGTSIRKLTKVFGKIMRKEKSPENGMIVLLYDCSKEKVMHCCVVGTEI